MDNTDEIAILLLSVLIGYFILFKILIAAIKAALKETNEKLQEITDLLRKETQQE